MSDKINLNKLTLFLGVLLFTLFSGQSAFACNVTYTEVDNNPTYKSVTELPFREADKKIAYGDDPNQYGLLWKAENHANRNTLVIFIHGGCWLSMFDISHTYAAATAIAKAGHNVWSLEYRRAGETGGGWPATFEDIKAGIIASGKLIEHGIKPTHIIIAGHSAGGHLALMSGAKIEQILPKTKAKLTIVGLAAIADMVAYGNSEGSCPSGGVKFMEGKPADHPEKYRDANPANYFVKLETLLFQGRVDPIVPVSQTEAMRGQFLVRPRFVDRAGHFDWVHPGTPAFRKFIDFLQTKVSKPKKPEPATTKERFKRQR